MGGIKQKREGKKLRYRLLDLVCRKSQHAWYPVHIEAGTTVSWQVVRKSWWTCETQIKWPAVNSVRLIWEGLRGE